MCSNTINAFRCLNDGYCSQTHTCICISACFVGNFCENNYNAAHLPLTSAIVQDLPASRDVYVVVFLFYGLIGLINNTLALTTFVRERIRITAYGVYLILFSILSAVLMMIILTYIMTAVLYYDDLYRASSCRIFPVLSLIMADASTLCTVAIAVERVLIECFNFNTNGSRRRGLLVSCFIMFYVTGSNIDELFVRRISTDESGREICIYDFEGHPIWHRFDTIFSYTHIIIPSAAHFVCSICVLTSIARRKIFIHSTEQKFCHVWLQQLYFHRDFFIPPICIVLCVLPHAVLGHLVEACLPYTDKSKLRLHISTMLLPFVPQMLNFLLYVYPNEIYWKEFQLTFPYRKLCCYCYRKQRRSRRQTLIRMEQEQRKMSVFSVIEKSVVFGTE